MNLNWEEKKEGRGEWEMNKYKENKEEKRDLRNWKKEKG